jgi:predicted DNA-binding transcriptional regulator AlpA
MTDFSRPADRESPSTTTRTPANRAPIHDPASEVSPLVADIALIDVRAVAELLGVSESWVWERTKGGHFPQPVRLGSRCTRWRVRDIRLYVASLGSSAPGRPSDV